ncbi:hypothetical protein CAPTEDRAFT_108272, partial [Capitella teleta]
SSSSSELLLSSSRLSTFPSKCIFSVSIATNFSEISQCSDLRFETISSSSRSLCSTERSASSNSSLSAVNECTLLTSSSLSISASEICFDNSASLSSPALTNVINFWFSASEKSDFLVAACKSCSARLSDSVNDDSFSCAVFSLSMSSLILASAAFRLASMCCLFPSRDLTTSESSRRSVSTAWISSSRLSAFSDRAESRSAWASLAASIAVSNSCSVCAFCSCTCSTLPSASRFSCSIASTESCSVFSFASNSSFLLSCSEIILLSSMTSSPN